MHCPGKSGQQTKAPCCRTDYDRGCYYEQIDGFIRFYDHERIQLKIGAAPLSLRHSA